MLDKSVIAEVQNVSVSPILEGEGIRTRIDKYEMVLTDLESGLSVVTEIELKIQEFTNPPGARSFLASWKIGPFEMSSEKFKVAANYAGYKKSFITESIEHIPQELYFFTDKALEIII